MANSVPNIPKNRENNWSATTADSTIIIETGLEVVYTLGPAVGKVRVAASTLKSHRQSSQSYNSIAPTSPRYVQVSTVCSLCAVVVLSAVVVL